MIVPRSPTPFDVAREKVVARINRDWSTKLCPMCNANSWQVHGYVTLGLSAGPGEFVLGGPALPCAAAVCQKCGNTVLINLVIAGAVDV